MTTRKPYPSDVSDEEWEFVAPYLALVREDAPSATHDLREVLNGLRWVVRTGSPWRYMPNDLPPWEAIYQQTQRWIKAGVFEQMIHDLRVLLRLSEGRASDPTAAILDSRTLRSTPESGHRGGYDGHKGKKGTKVHAAVDTLGQLLALRVSPANEDDREAGGGTLRGRYRKRPQRTSNWLMWIRDTRARGPPGSPPNTASGSKWSSTRRPSAASCSCRGVGWWNAISHGHRAFRRLVKDYERLPETVAGLHFVAFACLFLQQAAGILSVGHNTL